MVPEHSPEDKPQASLAEPDSLGHKNTRKIWQLIKLQSSKLKADYNFSPLVCILTNRICNHRKLPRFQKRLDSFINRKKNPGLWALNKHSADYLSSQQSAEDSFCLPIALFYLPVKILLKLLLEMVDQAKHEPVLQILYF